MKEAKNHDTIKSNGSIGFGEVELYCSVNVHHIAVKIMNNNHAMIHQTIIQMNIFPNISHPDD